MLKIFPKATLTPAAISSGARLVSAVSLDEIQAGIEITREQNEAKALEIERWADLMAASYNVLPMDAEILRIWAKLMHRRSDTGRNDRSDRSSTSVDGGHAQGRGLPGFRR